MSLSISTSPAAASSDAAAANVSGTKNAPTGPPFDAVLDDQTGADDGDAALSDASGAAALGDPPAADLKPGLARAGTASLAILLEGLGLGLKQLIGDSDDLEKELAMLKAIGKDKPGREAAALLMLAAQNAWQGIESKPLPDGAPPAATTSSKAQTTATVDDQAPLPPAFAPATTDVDAPPDSVSDAIQLSLSDSFTPSTDASNQQTAPPPGDPARLPELPFARSLAASPATTLADAIRSAAAGHGAFADQDKGFGDPSTTMGFDRRGSKGVPPGIQVAQLVANSESAVAAAAPATEAPPALPNESEVVSSIVQSIRMQMRDGIGTAVVHLEPDYLGPVSIAIRVEGGVVSATLNAENPQVRAWMQANEGQLREGLAGQGLSLDRLLVTDERLADERASARHQQQEQQQQEQHARQRPRQDDAATFEVVV